MPQSDRPAFATSGFLALPILVLAHLLTLACLAAAVGLLRSPLLAVPLLLTEAILAVCLAGFTIIGPNQARVLVFFGRYAGTLSEPGFWWVNPLTTRQAVSLRVRNFTSDRLKVNDATGNPIEIAAVVVWCVRHPARALLDVENYEAFVSVQADMALRGLASQFAYDAHDDGHSLRGSPEHIAERLKAEIQSRLGAAGVIVDDARISHLAYAPEIAHAMLRRQQAAAIIAARQQIVDGAVGMVQMALKRLTEEGVVTLDEERKAAMVGNLLVVLVGDHETSPVINAGSLY
jgi:regulator of protease activity HflC (stomatin/prohibitin superfamily)